LNNFGDYSWNIDGAQEIPVGQPNFTANNSQAKNASFFP
jgi:hypothetical protein